MDSIGSLGPPLRAAPTNKNTASVFVSRIYAGILVVFALRSVLSVSEGGLREPQRYFYPKISNNNNHCFSFADRIFLICNATLPLPRVIYSSDRFNELSGFSRPEVMQNNCTIKFLHGTKTDLRKISEIEAGVGGAEELQVEVFLYKKDGKQRKYVCFG